MVPVVTLIAASAVQDLFASSLDSEIPVEYASQDRVVELEAVFSDSSSDGEESEAPMEHSVNSSSTSEPSAEQSDFNLPLAAVVRKKMNFKNRVGDRLPPPASD